MAHIQTTSPTAFSLGITRRLTTVIAAFITWNDTRATRRSLGKLTDLQLADIGLNRGDVDAITR